LIFQTLTLDDSSKPFNKIIIHRVLTAYTSRLLKLRTHDSRMTGEMQIEEWYQRHPGAMHSHLGVFSSTFKLVLYDLETVGGGLAPTRYISIRGQLAIFLYICKEGLGVRHAGEAFQRSLDTVSKWVIPFIPMLTLSSFKAVVQAFTCPTYYYHWARMPT